MTKALPLAIEEINGQHYWRGAKGELVPEAVVRPKDKLADQTVRSLFERALALSAEISAFKAQAFADVDAYMSMLDEKYGVKAGGPKGNLTIFSYDGLAKVTVQTADQLQFGEEIHAAKALIDECLAEWTIESRPSLRALITDAFRPDKEGHLNRYAVLRLQRLEEDDPRWKRAMQAITDSQRSVGSSRYIRFHMRANPQAPWVNVSLDVATA